MTPTAHQLPSPLLLAEVPAAFVQKGYSRTKYTRQKICAKQQLPLLPSIFLFALLPRICFFHGFQYFCQWHKGPLKSMYLNVCIPQFSHLFCSVLRSRTQVARGKNVIQPSRRDKIELRLFFFFKPIHTDMREKLFLQTALAQPKLFRKQSKLLPHCTSSVASSPHTV